MYTFLSIIFVFVTLCIMGEMTLDYECDITYYIPCVISLVLSFRQISKAASDFVDKGTKRYDWNNEITTITYHGEKHEYMRPTTPLKKEAINKCKRNFTIIIDNNK